MFSDKGILAWQKFNLEQLSFVICYNTKMAEFKMACDHRAASIQKKAMQSQVDFQMERAAENKIVATQGED